MVGRALLPSSVQHVSTRFLSEIKQLGPISMPCGASPGGTLGLPTKAYISRVASTPLLLQPSPQDLVLFLQVPNDFLSSGSELCLPPHPASASRVQSTLQRGLKVPRDSFQSDQFFLSISLFLTIFNLIEWWYLKKVKRGRIEKWEPPWQWNRSPTHWPCEPFGTVRALYVHRWVQSPFLQP